MVYDANFILSCYPDIYTKDDLKLFIKVSAITTDQYKTATGEDYMTQDGLTSDQPESYTQSDIGAVDSVDSDIPTNNETTSTLTNDKQSTQAHED